MVDWMLMPIKKYATFSGRSRRCEFWYYTLFWFLMIFFLFFIEDATGLRKPGGEAGFLSVAFFIATAIPGMAVTSRRLHDIGKSGWWQLISVIPFIGPLLMLLFTVRDSQTGTNRFGVNPKTGA